MIFNKLHEINPQNELREGAINFADFQILEKCEPRSLRITTVISNSISLVVQEKMIQENIEKQNLKGSRLRHENILNKKI